MIYNSSSGQLHQLNGQVETSTWAFQYQSSTDQTNETNATDQKKPKKTLKWKGEKGSNGIKLTLSPLLGKF